MKYPQLERNMSKNKMKEENRYVKTRRNKT